MKRPLPGMTTEVAAGIPKSGAPSLGGPVAHIAMMPEEIVRRRDLWCSVWSRHTRADAARPG
jgi:hypothetical protein